MCALCGGGRKQEKAQQFQIEKKKKTAGAKVSKPTLSNIPVLNMPNNLINMA